MIKRYILSPCGTSLLTNHAKNDQRKLVFTHANAKSKDEVPRDDKVKLETLINNVSSAIDNAGYEEIKKMSAELNGIIKIYGGFIPSSNQDYHYLLSTDTWLGEETAKLVEKWLKSQNKNTTVVINRQKDLQTKDLSSFQSALSDLVKQFDEELPGFSADGYHIVFNLTGGFKSVQGFLQSIAHFFADETVYIFETSLELLKIPRLPIKMDATHIIEENITYFRNLALGLASEEQPDDIPETLLFTLEGKTLLSPWGELVWSKSKGEIYEKSLFSSPNPNKIRYEPTFEKNVAALPPNRCKIINERIDQLHRHLVTNCNLDSLDFKPLKAGALKNRKPSTHEIDAWADKDAKRIFGHFEEGCFVLDTLDDAIH